MTIGAIILILFAILFFIISLAVFLSSVVAGIFFLALTALFVFLAYNHQEKYDRIYVPEAEASAKGNNGIVLFDNETLTISRKGFSGVQGNSGDTYIPLKSLVYIKLQKPYAATNGFIQFVTSGSPEITDTLKAVQNSSCVIVTAEQYEKFVAFKEIVEEHMSYLSDSDVDEDVGPQSDILETIEKLSELKDKGILSEEEFQAKKKDLLNKL